MNRRLSAYFIIILISLSPFSSSNSSAETDGEPWRIVVFDSQSNSILAVTPEGIVDTWELPYQVLEIALSPSEDLAAVSFYGQEDIETTGYPEKLFLYDLEMRECCEVIVSQEMFTDTFEGNLGGFRIGGFNDDGTLLAVNYVYFESTALSEYEQSHAGLAVIDVSTGELIATQDTQDNYAMWLDEGVATYPHVQSPPGMSPKKYVEYPLPAWNPLTDETVLTGIRVPLIPYYDLHDVGDVLVTGERIVASFLSVADNNPSSILDYPYVLYSFNENTYPIWIESLPAQDEVLGLPRDRIARWISDGRYIYNRSLAYHFGEYEEEVQIVSRSGEVQYLEIPPNDFFLTGTPEGWLALRMLSDQPILVHYVYEIGVLQTEEIVTFGRNIRLLKKPQLGHSLENPSPFPEAHLRRSVG